jgi:hypothetical protein
VAVFESREEKKSTSLHKKKKERHIPQAFVRIIQVGHQDAKPKPSCEPAAKEVIALHMLIKRLPPKAKQSSQTHKSDTKKKIFFFLPLPSHQKKQKERRRKKKKKR